MNFRELEFSNNYLIEMPKYDDIRGSFQKIFTQTRGCDFESKESFITVSKKNVLRGMHFQAPPFDHWKLITVLKGSIVDIILDLRKSSSTYESVLTLEVNSDSNKSILLCPGIAHGFISKENDTTVLYNVSKKYNQTSDLGINPFTIGLKLNENDYILSDRDLSHPDLMSFISPFK